MIYTFTKTTEWTEFHKVKEDVLLRIAGIIERHGGALAFPTQTVHLQAAPTAGELPAALAPAGNG